MKNDKHTFVRKVQSVGEICRHVGTQVPIGSRALCARINSNDVGMFGRRCLSKSKVATAIDRDKAMAGYQ